MHSNEHCSSFISSVCKGMWYSNGILTWNSSDIAHTATLGSLYCTWTAITRHLKFVSAWQTGDAIPSNCPLQCAESDESLAFSEEPSCTILMFPGYDSDIHCQSKGPDHTNSMETSPHPHGSPNASQSGRSKKTHIPLQKQRHVRPQQNWVKEIHLRSWDVHL